MNIKYEKMLILIKNNHPIEITFKMFHWNSYISAKRHTKNYQYGWFICQDKLIVTCHGGSDGTVQIDRHNIKPLQYIVNKLGYLAKQYDNKIYIDCCYGKAHKQTVGGVEFIPLAPVQKISSSILETKTCFECDLVEDFLYFYNNIVKNFRIQVSYKII